MARIEIVRIWGTADQYDLNFSRVGGDVWAAELPVDMTDGQYACLLHAIDEHGGEAMWTGILYMHNGRATLTFDGDGPDICFSAVQQKRAVLTFDENGPELRFQSESRVVLRFDPSGLSVTI